MSLQEPLVSADSFLQAGCGKPLGKQVAHCAELVILPAFGEQHPQLRGGKFREHLQADAAGGRIAAEGRLLLLRGSRECKSDDSALTLADRLKDSGAFGTDARRIGGVFNIAAGKGPAARRQDRRPAL